ncbi:protein of unknown function [Paraburkholderia dioscoreae]|uniref:Uncharacterized protein n=1 Tax=Paraburkholderia dioscoreae TaxID=2604047 RepID=A0A5Q4ZCE1_9BURK|nr:protein of unknown function [Paraburkholderia dioscoreae]
MRHSCRDTPRRAPDARRSNCHPTHRGTQTALPLRLFHSMFNGLRVYRATTRSLLITFACTSFTPPTRCRHTWLSTRPVTHKHTGNSTGQ